MAWFGTLTRPQLKAAAAPNWPSDFYFAPVGAQTAAGVRVDAEQAMKLSTVWGCVRVLSSAVGMLPLFIYQRSGGGRQRAIAHPLYDLLHDRPNARQTAFSFKQQLMLHLLLRGNAYVEIKPGPRGPIDQLVPLNPDRLTVEQVQDGTRRYLYRDLDNTDRAIPDEQIWHLLGLTHDGVTGLSVIKYARESIGLGIALERHAESLFGNGARPGGIVKTKSSLSKEARERLRKSWNEQHQGVQNANRVTVLDEDMDWVSVGMSNEDAQFLASREFTREDLAGWFGVPPHLLGYLTKATTWGSGVEQLSLLFLIYTLMPWLTIFEQSVGKDLIIANQRYYAEFLVDAILRGDAASRAQSFLTQEQGGALTPNEWRAAENRDPVPGGDQTILPLNFAPADRLGAAQDTTRTPVPPPAAASASADIHRRRLIEAGAARIVQRERARLTSAATKHPVWAAAVNEFYDSHIVYVTEHLAVSRPTAAYYVEAQRERLTGGLLSEDEWGAARLELIGLAMDEAENEKGQ